MCIRIDTTMTLGELRSIVAEQDDLGRTEDSYRVHLQVGIEGSEAFDALVSSGYLDDWEPERPPTLSQLGDLRDAVAEVRRGNIPMALVLFARLFDSDAEYSVVEQALRARPARGLVQ